MEHLKFCRKKLAHIFPNYGSDCTCGAEHLLALVQEKYDEGPEALSTYLNDKISWVPKRELTDNDL